MKLTKQIELKIERVLKAIISIRILFFNIKRISLHLIRIVSKDNSTGSYCMQMQAYFGTDFSQLFLDSIYTCLFAYTVKEILRTWSPT